MQQGRIKVSVSLPRDLVARIDQVARAESRSRSRVLEGWLRKAAHARARLEVEASTIAYYDGLSAAEQHEEASLAAALSQAGRRLDVDGATAAPARQRSRR